MRTCCLLASVLVVLSLLAGCTKPEPSVPIDTAPPQAGPEVAAPEAGNATAAAGDEGGEQSKVLVGTLRVGVPCGLAMAYQATRDLFKQRYPDVKFEDHVKNIGTMTKEVRDGKLVLDLFISLGEGEMKTLVDDGAVEVSAHNITVLGHMWTFRRWFFGRKYIIDDYIRRQTGFILGVYNTGKSK